jgi:3-methyladenine DNA glycosylase AlkD
MQSMDSIELMSLENDFKNLENEEVALKSQRFFKTSVGEYGEGDIFLGIRTPELRNLVKKYKSLPFKDIETLLYSKYHEKRLLGAFFLVKLFKESKKDIKKQEEVYNFYLKHKSQMNNWDIIDTTAPHVIGAYLLAKENKDILYDLAISDSLWDRRISIISTWFFVRNSQYYDLLKIAKILMNDKEDLIHKAVGWMLREVGKKDLELEENFLIENNYKNMPRTMLRYAIEKFEESKRQKYLKGYM